MAEGSRMDAKTQMIGTRVTPALYDVIAKMAATQNKSVSKLASELLEKGLMAAGASLSNPVAEGKVDKLVQDLASLREEATHNTHVLSKVLRVAGGANCYAQYAATYALAMNRSMKERRMLDDALEDDSLQLLATLSEEFEEQLQSEIDPTKSV